MTNPLRQILDRYPDATWVVPTMFDDLKECADWIDQQAVRADAAASRAPKVPYAGYVSDEGDETETDFQSQPPLTDRLRDALLWMVGAMRALESGYPRCSRGAFYDEKVQRLAEQFERMKETNSTVLAAGACAVPSPQVDLETILRKEWWFNHGCEKPNLYGDDGEMQCNVYHGIDGCMSFIDFKRTPFEKLQGYVSALRLQRAAKCTESACAVPETQKDEPCRCAKPAPLVPGAKCRRCHRWTVAAVETDGTMRRVAAKQDAADWPDTWICQKCGNRWSMAQGKCSHDGTDRPAVPVQEEKQHDAIGGPLHAAGNVDMCNCDTCRLPTRNLLEIGSIPNVTTGQPQRVFVEWPSSAIPVPAVPVQDAPPKAWVLIGPAEQQGQGSMWACTKCGAAIQRHQYPEPEAECEFCEPLAFPAVQDALTTGKDGKHFIPLTGKPPCPTCGQPEGIQLTVGATGFSCGTGFEHKPECAANFCPHGVRWTGDCPLCDAEHYDEEGEDEVNDNRR